MEHKMEAPLVEGKVHRFYIVKVRRYEDPKLEADIKAAYGVIKAVYEARAQIVQDLEFQKMDHDKVRRDMRWHRDVSGRGGWSWEHYMRRDLQHLQQCLQQLSSPNNEWETRVKELKRSFVHDKPSRSAERKLCKDLTRLLQTRDLFDHEQAKEKDKIIRYCGSEHEIRQQIERIKRELKAHAEKNKEDTHDYKSLQRKKEAIEKVLLELKGKTLDLNKQKAKAYKCILDSNKLQAINKTDYDEYFARSSAAKKLAKKKELMGLEELVNQTNERFMARWNNDNGFRQVYKKRVASFLDQRRLKWDRTLHFDKDT